MQGLTKLYNAVPALASICFAMTFMGNALAHPHSDHAEKVSTMSDVTGTVDWKVEGEWHQIGNGHGGIAVASSNEVYVSVVDEAGGIHVYTPEGKLIRKFDQAPADIHGFVLLKEDDGEEVIYATQLEGDAAILKFSLNGELLLSIPKSVIPKENWDKLADDVRAIKATSIVVVPNQSIYIVTGYGSDLVHRFDIEGNYLNTFGGRKEPYNFANAHSIVLDSRYDKPRLLVTDRYHGRLIHLSLDGEIIGEYAKSSKRPGSVAFWGDIAAIGELDGSITLFDKAGEVIGTLGVNSNAEEVRSNQIPPETWREGILTAPHGITFDNAGKLLVTEWNVWGRVIRYDVDLDGFK